MASTCVLALYCFFFLPGLTPARTFRALAMSRSDHSRTLCVATSVFPIRTFRPGKRSRTVCEVFFSRKIWRTGQKTTARPCSRGWVILRAAGRKSELSTMNGLGECGSTTYAPQPPVCMQEPANAGTLYYHRDSRSKAEAVARHRLPIKTQRLITGV